MRKRIWGLVCLVLIATPAWAQELTKSSNFVIETPSISNGSNQTSSNNYNTRGTLGSTFDGNLSSNNYSLDANEPGARQADVLPKPSLSNDSDWVDRLLLIIDKQNNAPDTKYAVAISSDDFKTAWFMQSDHTIGQTLGDEDWLTYTELGGATGSHILGLAENTAYKVKVAATHGSFSETRYSAISDEARTSSSYLRLATDKSECSLGNLSPESTGQCQYGLALSTNYSLGAKVTVLGATLSKGGNTINPIGSSSKASQAGTEQFGFNLVANSRPAVGADQSGTNVNLSSEYATANRFAFTPNQESTIFASDSQTSAANVTVSWIANISSATVSGQYQTTITHTAYAQ